MIPAPDGPIGQVFGLWTSILSEAGLGKRIGLPSDGRPEQTKCAASQNQGANPAVFRTETPRRKAPSKLGAIQMVGHDNITDGKKSSGPAADPSNSRGQAAKPRPEPASKAPISERKLAANRANAQRSTGPKTPEGKQRSKQNSYKAGIFARQLFFPTEAGQNEWDGYKEVAERIYAHYRPQGVMEELLVDKVVTEAVRFARLLWFEREEFARKDAFWGQGSDKVLRYQTAINRQLTKAVEQLEDLQAERKPAGGTCESGPGSESGAVAEEPCDLPWEPGSGGSGQVIPGASNSWPAGPVTVDSACEATARQPFVAALDSVSFGPAKTSGDAPQRTEIYKTNPPKPNSVDEGGRPGKAEADEVHSLVEITEQAAGLPTHLEPNDVSTPTSIPGTGAPDVALAETNEQAIFDSL